MTTEANKQEPTPGSISITGNVGPGTAIGTGASVKATNIAGRDIIIDSSNAQDVAAAFAQIYAAVDARSFPTETAAQEVREAVELIEAENEKGDEANEKIVRMSFRTLAQMAPDILQVAIATFVNPALGISLVVKKIAEKAKAEGTTGG